MLVHTSPVGGASRTARRPGSALHRTARPATTAHRRSFHPPMQREARLVDTAPHRGADRRRTSFRGLTLLAVAVAATFVVSVIGLAISVPAGSELNPSAPAIAFGAVGMVSAVAGFVAAYLKAVRVADDQR